MGGLAAIFYQRTKEIAMHNGLNRRRFLQAACTVGAGIGVLAAAPVEAQLFRFRGNKGDDNKPGDTAVSSEPPPTEHPRPAPKPPQPDPPRAFDWHLSCAAYCFNQLSLYQTIKKVARLRLNAIEGFNFQRLDKDPKVLFGESLSPLERMEVRKRLDDAGVKMVSCYIRKLDEREIAKKVFELAKELEIATVVAEPPPTPACYDMLEKLCEQYQVKLAVHNHPQPSQYWNPDTLLGLLKGRGKWIGACADTGHWVRSGLDPVASLAKLEGRLITFHLKDVGAAGSKQADCVPFGTGKGNIDGILKECQRQGFHGYFGIEYEPYRPDNVEKIAACIEYFLGATAKLAAAS
jgi:sugar phosphate isomerase/epimerase